MRDVIIQRVFLFGVLAILSIVALQTYWMVSTWNANEEEFDEKARTALYRVASSLADYHNLTLPARNLIKRRSQNYYVVNIETEINPEALEIFLQKELQAKDLTLDFEYAVFDCSTKQMVYGDYCAHEDDKGKKTRVANLPLDPEFTYYFGVRFPTHSNFLLDRMQVSFILTGILLITVLFFAYSLWVIFRQRRYSEMQKDFINNMTHEFKTPLSTIQIAADVFLNNQQVQGDARLHQYAGIIKEQNTRLNQQVERVLQIARFEKDDFELQREPLLIQELIQTVAGSAILRVNERQGKLSLELDSKAPQINADRFHLTNLLHSLLDNAVKYSKDTPQINIRLWQSDQQIKLAIEDQGIGIPKEFQAKIFEKFYRVPTGNIHNVKGFGLGLYYVQRICLAHGWKIRLESTPEMGTTFYITMPKPVLKPQVAYEGTPAVR
jgi:two-component system, OmpR family, phosphate regulon sensor histidine kinase PhoR